MNGYCITCRFCDHSERHVCTLGRLPIDDPYSDSCASYEAKKEQPYIIGVDLAPEPKEDFRLCPDCRKSIISSYKEDNHAE